MTHDLRNTPRPVVDACDVCILGGGPAGIVTALELARARPDWHIVLAEGGGLLAPSKADKDSYVGTSTGDPAYPLAGSRLRYLGGTSNHWGGWCRPLDEEDFAKRSWMPLSGWPLTREMLIPWYEKSAVWCEIGSNEYDESALTPAIAASVLALDDSKLLRNKFFRFSPPTRFGTRYRADLETTSNLDVLLHATAVGLEFTDDRVNGVRLANHGGFSTTLKSRHVVVALGGIESARFLLMHEGQAGPASGLASPMLGRCFADHIGLTPASALLPEELEYSRIAHPTGTIMPVLAFEREAQRSLGLADCCALLVPKSDASGMQASYGQNTALGFRGGEHWNYDIQFIIEPQANPDSRVRLGDERDHLGMPRVQLDWRIKPDDYLRCLDHLPDIAAELGALGLGRLRLRPRDEFMNNPPGVGWHHLGTTRMSGDVENGVVDSDCRVHGIENLHVASSSVFPAFGFSNPTLTIVALAARLAAHMADQRPAAVKESA